MPKCTIKDISKMAGVSVGTVSRVLNNAGNVDPEIVRKTMDAVKAANFVPSRRGPKPQAKESRAGRSAPLIVVIAPEMSSNWTGNALWSEYLSGVERACAARGAQYSVLMAESLRPGSRLDEFLREGDGVLLKTPQTDLSILARIPESAPLAGFGAFNAALQAPQCALDDNGAGRSAAEALIALGHRHIAFASGSSRNRMFVARAQGYVEALKMAGLFRQEALLELDPGEQAKIFSPESGLPAMDWALDATLKLSPRPTAAIFANDWMALGFMKSCAARGLSIPRDLSIAGIDGLKPFCELSTPPLASVEIPFAESSFAAANMLLDLMAGLRAQEPSTLRLPTAFAPRLSAAPLLETQDAAS